VKGRSSSQNINPAAAIDFSCSFLEAPVLVCLRQIEELLKQDKAEAKMPPLRFKIESRRKDIYVFPENSVNLSNNLRLSLIPSLGFK